ncbi:unnamed protein product [Prorocentrum cordatum]|uniref:Uncharacterized protein n=1 Tax=Prorocentrum cordatum TaxID=2364126 RepID=A0ABN9SIS4_9DINO|nr:unnamed protein product [Polarella glacialis]
MDVEKTGGSWRPRASSANSKTGGGESSLGEDAGRKTQKAEGGRVARGTAGTEGTAQRPRIRRGGRRRAEAKERKITTKDSGLKELILHPTMLVAQLAQRSRAMWGITARAVLLEESVAVVKAMQTESSSFAQIANDMRSDINKIKQKAKDDKDSDAAAARKHDLDAEQILKDLRNLGPPAPAVFCSMLEALSKEEIGRQNREFLQATLAEMDDQPPTYVRLCKLEGCKQPDTLKIAYALDRTDLQMRIFGSFRAMGATVTVGSAPSGYLEDEVSAWIDLRQCSLAHLATDAHLAVRTDHWPVHRGYQRAQQAAVDVQPRPRATSPRGPEAFAAATPARRVGRLPPAPCDPAEPLVDASLVNSLVDSLVEHERCRAEALEELARQARNPSGADVRVMELEAEVARPRFGSY